jgi:hypothetical protein
MNHIRIAVCSIVLLILAGCKGGKELISERPVSQEVRNNFESLMASYPDWNTFSAKGSADLSFGASGSLSASTQLRMVRGEVLQISVRIILGIEVARLYMTPDSLFLVNKMQKQYVAASLQEIGEKLSSPVSLQTVQDALLGRIFLLNSANNAYGIDDFEVLDTLPPFCRDFFRGIEPYTSTRTRLAYAYDIRLFFEFLHETNSFCKKREITELPLSVLDMVQRTDIEEYLDYMSLYQKDGKDITNEERGKARKLAALRSLYNYYFQSERIEKNTAALVPLPKRHEKEIIRLEPNEVAILLDQVEDGTKLTKKELEYHKKTKLRDVALLTLLLGTGIRVSECVGLDINDVDFNNAGHKIRFLRVVVDYDVDRMQV